MIGTQTVARGDDRLLDMIEKRIHAQRERIEISVTHLRSLADRLIGAEPHEVIKGDPAPAPPQPALRSIDQAQSIAASALDELECEIARLSNL